MSATETIIPTITEEQWKEAEVYDPEDKLHVARDFTDFKKGKALCGYKSKKPHECISGPAPSAGIEYSPGMKECPLCHKPVCTICICEGIGKGLL